MPFDITEEEGQTVQDMVIKAVEDHYQSKVFSNGEKCELTRAVNYNQEAI